MPRVKCDICKGKKTVMRKFSWLKSIPHIRDTCWRCQGEGEVVKKPNPEQMRKVAELIRKEGK